MANINDIFNIITDLIKTYESYCIFHEGATLDVIIDDSLSFMIVDDDADKEDTVVIEFDEGEKDTLNYLAIMTIISLFGYVIIHFDGLVISNPKQKKNIKITVLDSEIKSIVEKIVIIQDSEYIDANLEVVKGLRGKAKARYTDDMVEEFKQRVALSKALLNRRNV